MSITNTLTSDILNSVASKIGPVFRPLLGPPAFGAPPPQLRESFPVWMLRGADTIQPTDDLTALAVQTGRWHHQIHPPSGVPNAYARSLPLGPDPSSWSVREAVISELAGQIDDAITWVNDNISATLGAPLLSVPAYHVTCLWLVDDSNSANQRVVVCSAPASNSNLVTHKAYTSAEFLAALRASNHIVGIAT